MTEDKSWGNSVTQNRLQRGFKSLYSKGKSTKIGTYLTHVVVNVLLMLVLFYLLLNTYAYNWTGQLYHPGSGFNLSFLSGGIDNAIPLVPQWVIFYVFLFYPMVILTMLYFGFIEYKKGYALGWSLVIINAIAILIYIVFPVSTYWWRQDYLTHPIANDFWSNQVYSIWNTDTSFNCFPSLHAAVSTICFYAWFQYSRIKPSTITKLLAVIALAIAGGVILSTLFIKQHYIVDEIAGVALALAVGKIVFKRLWKPEAKSTIITQINGD